MKKTGIMTDSHSGILNEEAERLGQPVVPEESLRVFCAVSVFA